MFDYCFFFFLKAWHLYEMGLVPVFWSLGLQALIVHEQCFVLSTVSNLFWVPHIYFSTPDMSLQDGSNYIADVCGAKGKKVTQGSTPSDDHSSLPPSSLPVDLGDSDTKINVNENTPLRCKKRKTYQSRKEANAMTFKPGGVSGRGNNEPQVPKKPSTLLNAPLEEIQSFSDEVKVKAEELGQWLGKSAWDILVTAGFGVKPSHTKVNDVNLFCLWYWVTQPKPEGGKSISSPLIEGVTENSLSASRNEFNNTITREYNELMKDIPKDDVAARREKLKCVYEWQETSTVVPSNKSVKSIATRLENVKVQFSGLVSSWLSTSTFIYWS